MVICNNMILPSVCDALLCHTASWLIWVSVWHCLIFVAWHIFLVSMNCYKYGLMHLIILRLVCFIKMLYFIPCAKVDTFFCTRYQLLHDFSNFKQQKWQMNTSLCIFYLAMSHTLCYFHKPCVNIIQLLISQKFYATMSESLMFDVCHILSFL